MKKVIVVLSATLIAAAYFLLKPSTDSLETEVVTNSTQTVLPHSQPTDKDIKPQDIKKPEEPKVTKQATTLRPEVMAAQDKLQSTEPKTVEEGVSALIDLGAEAVAQSETQLVDLLEQAEDQVKSTVLFALAKNKEIAARHLDQLEKQLKSEDMSVLDSALYAVAMVGKEASKIQTEVSTLLENTSAKVREEAAFALGRIKDLNAHTINTLKDLSENDSSPQVREAAANALRLAQGGKQFIDANSSERRRGSF